MSGRDSLLRLSMEAAVSLNILALRGRGGPDDHDVERAREAGLLLASKGDVLMFGGKRGEAAHVFNETAFGLAVMSFCPGGVTFMGCKWEEHREEQESP